MKVLQQSLFGGDEMIGYRPQELKIEVNRACPLQCLHCSSNGVENAPESLSPHRVRELIREFACLGGRRVCISGGEPLCYQELSSVIDSSRQANIDVSLYTTGIVSDGGSPKLISEQMAAFLAEKHVKAIFSLHGACARTHETLTRVKGSFDATVKAIERVKKAGAVVEAHVVPTAINFHELVNITRLISSLNINKISWLRFVPQGRGWFNRRILELSKNQLWALSARRTESQQICPDVTIRTGAPFNILCPKVPASCEAGTTILTVSPDGIVSPCDAFKRFRSHDDFGSVLEHSFAKVWRMSYVLNTVRALREARLDSPCASCSLYLRCNSGCLAQKAISSGTLTDGRDPDCPLDGIEVVRDEIKTAAVC
jgi:radical SAM protein with 4Fe4S-binding SPASM domain